MFEYPQEITHVLDNMESKVTSSMNKLSQVDLNDTVHVGEEETYFNESFESEPSPFSINKDSDAHTRTPHEVPSLPVNSAHPRRQPQSRRRRNVMRGPKVGHPQQNYHRYRPPLSTGAIVSLETELSLEAWQASQNLIASLRSENHLLQSQLKECRVELRTVQRQCKVQSARLTKAVGREAEMPAVIERLNAEVRAMQVRLRRKKEAAEAAERRALDAEARLLPLLEKRDRRSVTVSSAASVSAPVSGHGETKNHTKAVDTLQSALDEERRKHGELQKKLDMMERNHRAEQGVANEQIRKLRKFANELQAQLSAVTRTLQEKTKLLELQNIYSQRFPKSVVTQTTGIEHQRERGRASGDRSLEGDVPGETLHHRYSSHRLTNSRLPSNDSNGDGEKRRRSRHNVCPISNMVAKMKNGLFTRSYTTMSNTRGGDDTVEGKEPSTTAGGILSRSLKLTNNNFPVPAARGRRKNEHREGDDIVQAATTAGAEMTINPAIANSGSSTCSDDETMSDLRDNFHKIGEKRDVMGKRNAPQPKEEPLTEAKLSSIEKKMQGENGQCVNRQETQECKEEEAPIQLPDSTKSDLPTPPGDRFEQNREEFLWRSIFGKKSSDLLSFITSQPVSSLASAENETSKVGTVETETVRGAIEPTGGRSLRRQNSVRNPLDDLDLEKIKL